MKETNYWQQFMSTGSIKDYLNYCTECGKAVSDSRQTDRVSENLGVNSYAGVCGSNRNDFEGGACR